MKRFLTTNTDNVNSKVKCTNQQLKLNTPILSTSDSLILDNHPLIIADEVHTSNSISNNTSSTIEVELKKISILNENQKDIAKNYELDKWISNEHIIYKFNSNNNVNLNCDNTTNIIDLNEIHAFDLDFTVIITKSGETFPINEDDWKLFHITKVKETLLKLHNEKKYIVIMSNQGYIYFLQLYLSFILY